MSEDSGSHWDWALPTILVSFICCLSYGQMRCFTRKARLLAKFPSVPKFPLIGGMWLIMKNPRPEGSFDAISYNVKTNGKKSVFWMGPKPYIVLADANTAQKVLSSTEYLDKGSDYQKLHWLLGEGLITSCANIWTRDRKILSPPFHYQRLVGFIPIFNKNAKRLVANLERTFSNHQEFNLHSTFCRSTMDSITEAALGRETDFLEDLESEFMKAVYIALDLVRTQILRPYLCFPVIQDLFGITAKKKFCMGIFTKYVEEAKRGRIIALQTEKDKTQTVSEGESIPPFIDTLLSPENEFDNLDVTGHITTIFSAGFETTGSCLNYSLFLLANNPQCLARVHAELDSIFANDPERDVTFKDITEMKYLGMCIKETLRLYPSVPNFFRMLKEDVEIDDGLTIPKGVDLYFSTYELHRDPLNFPDPERFEPERFLPDVCAERHPYAYMPFSMGPRNCLGFRYATMLVKTSLAHILRKFTVTSSLKREDMKVMYGVVLEPSTPIQLTLSPRKVGVM